MNHEIRLSPIKLIDENNKQVGVIETQEAMRMAEAAGLDLVEIQPNVRPPLCKIMDYGKYRYELSKKSKGSQQKQQELKQIRLGRSAKIDPHDVEIRVKQARKFLLDGHKVQIEQRFRGREMAFQEIGRERLDEIAKELGDIAKVESPPKTSGRQMTLLLAPDKPKIELYKKKQAQEKAASGEAPPEEAPEAEASSAEASQTDEGQADESRTDESPDRGEAERAPSEETVEHRR